MSTNRVPFISRKLNTYQPISYEIGYQSRTRLVCKLVRDSFPKVQLSDNDNGTKTLWTANFSNMLHWVSHPFYIQNLEKRRKIVIFAVGYGVKAVARCNCYCIALSQRDLRNHFGIVRFNSERITWKGLPTNAIQYAHYWRSVFLLMLVEVPILRSASQVKCIRVAAPFFMSLSVCT